MLSIAFSPKGQIFASSSSDKTVKIWDYRLEKTLKKVPDRSKEIPSLAFSPSMDVLAIAVGSYIDIWDYEYGKSDKIFKGHGGKVMCVAFSPDGKLLASGSAAGFLRLWDMDHKSGRTKDRIKAHENKINFIAYSPNGEVLASASEDYTIKLWNGLSGDALRTLGGHEAAVLSIAISADGKYLVSTSNDFTARLWDISSGGLRWDTKWHTYQTIAFSPNGKVLAFGDSKGEIIYRDANSLGRLVASETTNMSARVNSLAFSPCGKHLVSGTGDGKLRVWDTSSIASLEVSNPPSSENTLELQLTQAVSDAADEVANELTNDNPPTGYLRAIVSSDYGDDAVIAVMPREASAEEFSAGTGIGEAINVEIDPSIANEEAPREAEMHSIEREGSDCLRNPPLPPSRAQTSHDASFPETLDTFFHLAEGGDPISKSLAPLVSTETGPDTSRATEVITRHGATVEPEEDRLGQRSDPNADISAIPTLSTSRNKIIDQVELSTPSILGKWNKNEKRRKRRQEKRGRREKEQDEIKEELDKLKEERDRLQRKLSIVEGSQAQDIRGLQKGLQDVLNGQAGLEQKIQRLLLGEAGAFRSIIKRLKGIDEFPRKPYGTPRRRTTRTWRIQKSNASRDTSSYRRRTGAATRKGGIAVTRSHQRQRTAPKPPPNRQRRSPAYGKRQRSTRRNSERDSARSG